MADKEQNLSSTWSEYLKKAIKDYQCFMAQSTPMEPKDFAAYHNAGKAALAHIAMIKKMIEEPDDKAKEMDFFDLLEQAREATHEDDRDNSFD